MSIFHSLHGSDILKKIIEFSFFVSIAMKESIRVGLGHCTLFNICTAPWLTIVKLQKNSHLHFSRAMLSFMRSIKVLPKHRQKMKFENQILFCFSGSVISWTWQWPTNLKILDSTQQISISSSAVSLQSLRIIVELTGYSCYHNHNQFLYNCLQARKNQNQYSLINSNYLDFLTVWAKQFGAMQG